ncbi:T9SS C-terminal target domain-containing protein [bacterium]|nr:MAG: T9SS C-terminal target domain-containing protein [bacterium]
MRKKHHSSSTLILAISSAWFITIFLPVSSSAKTYFVSPGGSDAAGGTFDQPFLTIVKAHSVVAAGDTILVRGGTHFLNTTISLTRSGTSTNGLFLLAYSGERPLLDFSSMAVSGSNRGIQLSGSRWTVKGFDIKGAGDNGMFISGSFNTVDFCALFENRDTGLQLGSGASNNRIINCDSYYNVDPGQGNADGFSPKLDVGTGNYFYGCRCWQNSDDGWDGYLRPSNDVTTTLENCWSFNNGYLKDGTASSGNGNGFKMGGGDNGNADHLKHNMILKRCLAFDNRVKGFDQNNNVGSMTVTNCTAYRNGTNYSVSRALDSGKALIVVNCVALGSYGSLGGFAVQQTNSWLSPFSVSNADFVTVDTAGVRGPRKADGSLPDIAFLHLAPTSPMIDAGVSVGLPYSGRAPDLGAFESGPLTVIGEHREVAPAFRLEQNYPNPCSAGGGSAFGGNARTVISYQVPAPSARQTADGLGVEGSAVSVVTLKVYDALGREVARIVDSEQPTGSYRIDFNANTLPSGVYFARLQAGQFSKTIKLILTK